MSNESNNRLPLYAQVENVIIGLGVVSPGRFRKESILLAVCYARTWVEFRSPISMMAAIGFSFAGAGQTGAIRGGQGGVVSIEPVFESEVDHALGLGPVSLPARGEDTTLGAGGLSLQISPRPEC